MDFHAVTESDIAPEIEFVERTALLKRFTRLHSLFKTQASCLTTTLSENYFSVYKELLNNSCCKAI